MAAFFSNRHFDKNQNFCNKILTGKTLYINGLYGIDNLVDLVGFGAYTLAMKKRFIVNADDFGLCTGVNRAIERHIPTEY
jgi:hypothetical protein